MQEAGGSPENWKLPVYALAGSGTICRTGCKSNFVQPDVLSVPQILKNNILSNWCIQGLDVCLLLKAGVLQMF